jgi:hypothetical protein
MAGLIYILSDPVTILSSYLLPEYHRQFYFRLVDQSVHILMQGYILYQLKYSKSDLNKSLDSFTSLPGVK